MTFSLAAGRLSAVLAAGSGSTANNQPGGQGPEFGSAGPVALIVLVVLLVAVAFLIRSMTRHLKRVPASFDPPESPEGDGPDQAKKDS
jgi:hypothetical protein